MLSDEMTLGEIKETYNKLENRAKELETDRAIFLHCYIQVLKKLKEFGCVPRYSLERTEIEGWEFEQRQ